MKVLEIWFSKSIKFFFPLIKFAFIFSLKWFSSRPMPPLISYWLYLCSIPCFNTSEVLHLRSVSFQMLSPLFLFMLEKQPQMILLLGNLVIPYFQKNYFNPSPSHYLLFIYLFLYSYIFLWFVNMSNSFVSQIQYITRHTVIQIHSYLFAYWFC